VEPVVDGEEEEAGAGKEGDKDGVEWWFVVVCERWAGAHGCERGRFLLPRAAAVWRTGANQAEAAGRAGQLWGGRGHVFRGILWLSWQRPCMYQLSGVWSDGHTARQIPLDASFMIIFGMLVKKENQKLRSVYLDVKPSSECYIMLLSSRNKRL
jgi:hypothetical protein